jgi:hypothetical protein
MNIQREIQGTSEGKLIFESIPKKTFDYSLGGYYHRSAGHAPDNIIEQKQAATRRMQEKKFT